MTQQRIALMVGALFLIQTGCANRCYQPCGLAGGTRVAPPPTYSLNIPSVAQNQPYYTPGAGAAVNPAGQAPMPAGGGGQWRAPDPSVTPGASTAPAQPSASQSRFVETNSPVGRSVLGQINPAPSTRMAALPGSGTSFTDSRNFQTTQADERTDSTRLPVTDATGVRAPSQNLVAGYGVSQTYAQAYNQPQVYTASGIMIQGAPQVYSTQPIVVGNGFGFQRPTQQTANANQQLGWRGRELAPQQLR
jgi:hypothetical protein